MFKTHKQPKQYLSERQQRIFDFLDETRVGVLTSVDPNGEPHGSVIYFAVEPDFVIHFLTRRQTKKADNLIRNSHVMLVIFEPKSQTVAQVTGKAELVEDGYEVNQIAAAVFMTSLKTSTGGIPPIAKLDAGEYVGFKIQPIQIRMASYVRPDPGGYEKIFESIESFELKS